MKKLLLIGLLTVFAGIGLAETPEIVNPPRPTKEYRWLLVVKHDWEWVGQRLKPDVFYIYTNKYRIRTSKDFGGILFYIEFDNVLTDPPQLCVSSGCFDYNDSMFMFYVGHRKSSLDSIRSVYFVIAKAPKPWSTEHDILAASDLQLIQNPRKPQKAKVVFTK